MKLHQKKKTEDEIATERIEQQQQIDPLANKNLKELNELEDDVEDRVLEEYRQKRIEELKNQKLRNRFGDVREITQPEFVKEVNQAGNDIWVVLHLMVASKLECKLLHQVMCKVAAKFKYVKFLRIRSTDCIPNYPDANCPTLLIYKNGDLAKTEVGLTIFGGLKTNEKTFEWILHQWGIVQSELDDDPRKELDKTIKKVGPNIRRDQYSDDEDEDDI